MYKSRLHQWGLDKKKKEHEMLEVIRIGFQRKDIDKDSVFQIRGRPVTLGDALHYFSRKGIKDPQSLLDAPPESSSSPSEVDCQTPRDLSGQMPIHAEPDSLMGGADPVSKSSSTPTLSMRTSTTPQPTADFAQRQVVALQAWLRTARMGVEVPVKLLPINLSIPRELTAPAEYRYMECILTQTRNHFSNIFATRKLSINGSQWSATSEDGMSDRFYFGMYHGYSSLWNGDNDIAFNRFNQAFDLIEDLLRDQHVGFLIYVYDLVIRYEISGQHVLLHRLLQYLADMAKTVFSENHPIRLIAIWMMEATNIRSLLSEFILRRILDFFQDSIGYFHKETIALLQTFAWALMNREQYDEAAIRFKQLSDAFETTDGKGSYEACYALRAMAEAYFYKGSFGTSLEIVQEALHRSSTLPREQEREIYARCLRQIAEIAKKLGKDDESEAAMQKCVDCCKESFGADHPFVTRAIMHQMSLRKDGCLEKPTIPSSVHRLGKGGGAAKYIWASESARAS